MPPDGFPSPPRARADVSPGAFSFIDLFAGIGGMRRGFEAAGGVCVFTSERDRFARTTYEANFVCNHEIAGDIRLVPEEAVPAHDMLLAGFPCQPFSLAGVSKKNALGRAHGFACEAQGTLFFEIARLLKYHRPRAFLLENVKNLASHDGGRTLKVIRRVLTEELGYHISSRVIDAKGFLPQHRERIFILGFRDRPGLDLNDLEVPDPRAGPRLASILHGADEPPVDARYTLSDKLWAYLQAYAAKHRAAGNGFGFGLVGPNDVARTLSARYYKDGSEILIDQGAGKRPRRLTPRECARLMGFDEASRAPMRIPVSDTQAYKQFGNAVAVPVIAHIAHAVAPFLIDQPVACGDG